MKINFVIPCLLGVEGIIADELRSLEAEDVKAENGRVLFSGDENLLARVNICSHFAERVQILVGSFKATTFEELFQGTKNLPWEEWIGSDHIIRIIPANNGIAGYLYCWLSTEYAQQLVKRNTFGAVVDEIDTDQLSHVEIPLLKNSDKRKEINNKVLQANELRYQAYLKEQGIPMRI